jgi:hypothetical protein
MVDRGRARASPRRRPRLSGRHPRSRRLANDDAARAARDGRLHRRSRLGLRNSLTLDGGGRSRAEDALLRPSRDCASLAARPPALHTRSVSTRRQVMAATRRVARRGRRACRAIRRATDAARTVVGPAPAARAGVGGGVSDGGADSGRTEASRRRASMPHLTPSSPPFPDLRRACPCATDDSSRAACAAAPTGPGFSNAISADE